MTGRRWLARALPGGVKTFRYRQSSDVLAWPNGETDWAQCGANWVASRTPLQRAAGCGGRQRSEPTGGAAYGIPRNSSAAPVDMPRTAPPAVATTGPAPEAAAPPAVTLAAVAPVAVAPAARTPKATAAAPSRARARQPIPFPSICISVPGGTPVRSARPQGVPSTLAALAAGEKE